MNPSLLSDSPVFGPFVHPNLLPVWTWSLFICLQTFESTVYISQKAFWHNFEY